MASTPVPAPAPAPTPIASDDTLALARRIAALVIERRGTDVVLLDVRPLVDYTDFFLVATGQSGRQNQAIGEHVIRSLKAERRIAISKSGLEGGSWICLDLGDVVVHVFDPETRARYDLELLWADAARQTLEAPVPAPEAAGKPRRRTVRRAAVEDADAANAPDSERPPEGEPEPETRATGRPAAKAPRARKAKAAGAPPKPKRRGKGA